MAECSLAWALEASDPIILLYSIYRRKPGISLWPHKNPLAPVCPPNKCAQKHVDLQRAHSHAASLACSWAHAHASFNLARGHLAGWQAPMGGRAQLK